MEKIMKEIENALGMYADGFWTENDAREVIENAIEEFFTDNK